jgi:tRNA(fMet)-specific endonuclease VapC
VSFVLDTNVCSAHMRRPAGLTHRFAQYAGRLHTSSIVLAELYSGAFLLPDPHRHLLEIGDMLSDMVVLEFGTADAECYGRIRGELRRVGKTVSPFDLLIAATALTHDFTLVTHNVKHFEAIPGLRIEDWLAP